MAPGEYLYGVFRRRFVCLSIEDTNKVTAFQQYTVIPPLASYFDIIPATKLQPTNGVSLTASLGACGLPGRKVLTKAQFL